MLVAMLVVSTNALIMPPDICDGFRTQANKADDVRRSYLVKVNVTKPETRGGNLLKGELGAHFLSDHEQEILFIMAARCG